MNVKEAAQTQVSEVELYDGRLYMADENGWIKGKPMSVER